jgi:Antimicrobial peptide resistance and lipid A acylation protein PagP
MEYRNQGVFADRAVSIDVARLPLAVLKTFLLLVVIAFALLTRVVQADELHLIVNGKAIHLEHQPGTHYNESNWGAGVQYDFEKSKSNWVPFLAASGFSDSNKNPSYYAGGGWLKRHEFSLAGVSMHTDLGFVVFAMWRQEFNGGKPFLGALPAFSIGSERVAVNVTYIPKVDPKMVPILFFQLKLKLSNF